MSDLLDKFLADLPPEEPKQPAKAPPPEEEEAAPKLSEVEPIREDEGITWAQLRRL